MKHKKLQPAKRLQRNREKFIALELVKIIQPDLEFSRMGDDRQEPDVVFNRDKKTIGIEVGTAYYDEENARAEWAKSKEDRTFPSVGYETHTSTSSNHHGHTICQRIQKLITDKGKKEYEGTDQTWLCVEARLDLVEISGIEACSAVLDVPEKHGFDQIWLFYLNPLAEDGGYRAKKVYPRK